VQLSIGRSALQLLMPRVQWSASEREKAEILKFKVYDYIG
jgi:hypothetical protein